MLMPHERAQAIEILSNSYMNANMHYGGQPVKDMLKFGHKGFAQYTDLELMRAMQSLAKKTNNFEINNFISTIAAEKFVLE